MASISGVSNSITIAGLASGIDTDSIIQALTTINSRRIELLQTRKSQVNQQKSTFGDLRTKLLDLQTQTAKLTRSVAGAFDAKTAKSSDSDAIAVAASSSARVGSYTATVLDLAAANQIASEGFADTGANIKQGTLALRVGNGATTTVTIDSSNNTLQGLADAINGAGGDVRASIINDGTSTPYRLLLTSSRTGAANSIQVTNNLTSGNGATIDPANTTLQAASDARIRLGSGAGAVTITNSTNRIDKLFDGVTLDLKRAGANKTITIDVNADSTAAGDAVAQFVDSYNAVVEYIDLRDNYNQVTKEAGTLLGSYEANTLRQELATTLTGSVNGVNGLVNRLSTIGIKFTDTGRLEFNRSKLEDVFQDKVSGATGADVKRLFALTGASTNSGVRFLLGGTKTKPSGASPYQVDVTQAATQASLTAGSALSSSTVIDSSNNTFAVKLNGRDSSTLTIANGTYTAAQLASAVQATINADSALAGAQITADVSGGNLRLTSSLYGGSSQIIVGSGSAISSGVLGFSGSESANGLNVAGNFIVNGVVESATGVGQVLSGNSGNANTDGLQVTVTLATGQVVSGSDADLTVTQGLAERLGTVLTRYLDPISGRFKTTDKRFDSQIEDIDKTIARQDALLQARKDSLLARFAAMETAVGRLNAISAQISAQLLSVTSTAGNK